jgi:hypothetical protein
LGRKVRLVVLKQERYGESLLDLALSSPTSRCQRDFLRSIPKTVGGKIDRRQPQRGRWNHPATTDRRGMDLKGYVLSEEEWLIIEIEGTSNH